MLPQVSQLARALVGLRRLNRAVMGEHDEEFPSLVEEALFLDRDEPSESGRLVLDFREFPALVA